LWDWVKENPSQAAAATLLTACGLKKGRQKFSEISKYRKKEADACKTLGVKKGATKEEIKTVYRNLIKKYHPDFNRDDPFATKKCQEFNAAYEFLTKK
jgi:DnaJ-domain-containing protein 1